mgnify:CR=1 FL=1|jgi:hypothetical protein
MKLGKLGINGMILIGILVSISSIIVSIVSLFNGTYKDEATGETTNYKKTWRLINAILRTISLLMIVGIWVSVTFINKTSVLSTDFTWRLIIGTTIFLYLASAVLNWVNLFVSWGKGPGVHIARIIIETLNICIGLIQFWSYCTKFMANAKQQGVTDVMNKNPMYKWPMEFLHGKNLETTTSALENTKRNMQATATAQATVQATQEASQKSSPNKAFGERQRRRNN